MPGSVSCLYVDSVLACMAVALVVVRLVVGFSANTTLGCSAQLRGRLAQHKVAHTSELYAQWKLFVLAMSTEDLLGDCNELDAPKNALINHSYSPDQSMSSRHQTIEGPHFLHYVCSHSFLP